MSAPAWLQSVAFDADGLVPAIAQDAHSGKVLMVAWMNAEALAETARSGRAVYYSRSRRRLWRKGEESGHTQQVHDIRLDCDGDVILLQVTQRGGMACHTGRERCFFRHLDTTGADARWVVQDPVLKDPAEIYGKPEAADTATAAAARANRPPIEPFSGSTMSQDPSTPPDVLSRLADLLVTRLPENGGDPDSSYTARLLARGPNAMLKKVGEEATELVMACKDGVPERIVSEAADLWFHTLVVLAWHGLRPEDVLRELARREGMSGLQEKASRPAE